MSLLKALRCFEIGSNANVIFKIKIFHGGLIVILKKFTVIGSLAIALVACAVPPRYDFVKEGASEHQKTDALSECQYQIKLNKTPANEQVDLLRLCMQGKGFRYRRLN
jgi:hypothetical protein